MSQEWSFESPNPPGQTAFLEDAADQFMSDLSTADSEDEPSEDYFHEIDKRLEVASYYQELRRGSLFTSNTEASRIVEREVRRFVQQRLEILVGMRAPQPEAPTPVKLPFTDEQITALTVLAERLLRKDPVVPEAPPKVEPAIRQVQAPTPPAVAPKVLREAPVTVPKATPAPVPTAAKRGPKPKPAPVVATQPQAPAAAEEPPKAKPPVVPGTRAKKQRYDLDENGNMVLREVEVGFAQNPDRAPPSTPDQAAFLMQEVADQRNSIQLENTRFDQEGK